MNRMTMSEITSPAEKIDILVKALEKIAWCGWYDAEEGALEHIKIAVRALKDADEL